MTATLTHIHTKGTEDEWICDCGVELGVCPDCKTLLAFDDLTKIALDDEGRCAWICGECIANPQDPDNITHRRNCLNGATCDC